MRRGSNGFNTVLKYVRDVTREAGINTKFRVEGDEVVVVTKSGSKKS